MDRTERKRRARLAELRNKITDGLTLEQTAQAIREAAEAKGENVDLTASYLSKIISGAKVPARPVADAIVRYARRRGVTLADLGIEVK